MGGEEAFEEQGGGDLVDDVFAVEAGGVAGGAGGVAGRLRRAWASWVVRRSSRRWWVRVGCASWVNSEGLGEGLGFGGLGAGCAVGVEGIADEDELDVVLADEAGDGFEVGAEADLRWCGGG